MSQSNLSDKQARAIAAAAATFDGSITRLAAAVAEYAEHQPSKSETKTTASSKPPAGPVIVELQQVSRQYKMNKQTVSAIDNASITIHQGEFVAIIGASGSGKSTLLNLIGGLDRPDSGTITVAGHELAKLSDAQLSDYRNQTIGFVFQFFYLQPFLTVASNLEVPAMFGHIPRAKRQQRAQDLAKAVGISNRLGHLPKELSGGQMQRTAIARALINEPKILLADEPTGNLDSANSRDIMALFQQVRRNYGTTIIVVTHDSQVAQLADRTIAMHDGRVAYA